MERRDSRDSGVSIFDYDTLAISHQSQFPTQMCLKLADIYSLHMTILGHMWQAVKALSLP